MDAFVFPSTWEGLGIVAIEAQASGLECYLSRELPKEVEVTDTASEPENPEREDAPRSCVAHGTVLSGRD